tara:strand:+ start:110 stop:661 length:552 start_codon:yes stop_codon:yes gene_type:complete
MELKEYPYLVWLDLEMTGLDPDSERIIEIATVITSSDLEEVIEGPNLVINQPREYLDNMDEWNTSHHGNSGLIEAVKVSNVTDELAEKETLNFLMKYLEIDTSPLCGNSISQDRRFLNRYMPDLAKFFHYRNIDVSSIKELTKRWRPDLDRKIIKSTSHRALSDVYESIEELKFYRDNLFKKD